MRALGPFDASHIHRYAAVAHKAFSHRLAALIEGAAFSRTATASTDLKPPPQEGSAKGCDAHVGRRSHEFCIGAGNATVQRVASMPEMVTEHDGGA